MEWFIYVLISAIFLSSYDIIRKKVLKKEHSLEVLSVTFITVFLFSLLFLPFINVSIGFLDFLIVSTRAIIVATALLFLTRALHHLEISSVAPVNNLSPFFLLFLSVIFLNESVSFFQVIGIVLIVAGSYFLQIHSHYLDFFRHLKDFKNKYFFYAISAAALFSISAMISKIALTDISVSAYLFYSYLVMAIYFTAGLFIRYEGFSDIRYGFKQGKMLIPLMAIIVIIQDYSYFYAVSLPSTMISLIIPIRRLSGLFSVIIGGRMFHEHFLFHKIVSAVILIIGATLIIL